MNTRMLLTAVLRNRRSQWTLLAKGNAADAGAAENDVAVPPNPPADAVGAQRPEPAARPQ